MTTAPRGDLEQIFAALERQAGRPKDLADIAALEAIRREREVDGDG